MSNELRIRVIDSNDIRWGAYTNGVRVGIYRSKEETLALVAAPPRPRFETSRELQHELAANGAARPKIVVPIAPQLPTLPAQGFAAPQQPGRLTVPVAGNGQVARSQLAGLAVKPRRRARAFVVGLVLVICFAGLLLATGAYVRSRIRSRAAEQSTVNGIVGRDALTTTDLNLRDGPNVTNNQIGLSEGGSRVHVLNLNNNWCEVQVVQHSRPKDDPNSADHGWVNRKYLKFD